MQVPSLVDRRQMISPRTPSGRSLMRSGQDSCFSEPLSGPVPLLAATAMPPEDEVAGGPNLAFLLLGAPGRISIAVSVAGFAPPVSTAICGVVLEKLLGLHCGQISRVRKGGEGTSTNWTTTINYIFPSLLRWKTKNGHFPSLLRKKTYTGTGGQPNKAWCGII